MGTVFTILLWQALLYSFVLEALLILCPDTFSLYIHSELPYPFPRRLWVTPYFDSWLICLDRDIRGSTPLGDFRSKRPVFVKSLESSSRHIRQYYPNTLLDAEV